MIRTRNRGRELEEVGGRRAEIGGLEGAGDPREAGTEREREELRADRVDAHHLGGGLVLADGAPGTTHPRALEVARDDDADEVQHHPEVPRGDARRRPESDSQDDERIDRVDPSGPPVRLTFCRLIMVAPATEKLNVMAARFLKKTGTTRRSRGSRMAR